jgi:hypothetical protein
LEFEVILFIVLMGTTVPSWPELCGRAVADLAREEEPGRRSEGEGRNDEGGEARMSWDMTADQADFLDVA